GDVFEAQQDLLPHVSRDVYLLVHPGGAVTAAAATAVAGAVGDAQGVARRRVAAGQRLPGAAPIGGGGDVGEVVGLLDVKPEPVAQRRTGDAAQADGAGERRVDRVAAVGPPEAFAAGRLHGHDRHALRPAEVQRQVFAIRNDLQIAGGELVDAALASALAGQVVDRADVVLDVGLAE